MEHDKYLLIFIILIKIKKSIIFGRKWEMSDLIEII